jgi:hypothetical protein
MIFQSVNKIINEAITDILERENGGICSVFMSEEKAYLSSKDKKKLTGFIWKKIFRDDKMVGKMINGKMMKSTLKKGGKRFIHLSSSSMANAIGAKQYQHVSIDELKDMELLKLAEYFGVKVDWKRYY